VSVTSEVHDSLESSRYARLRSAFRDGSQLEPWIAPVVAVLFFALAYFEGGSDPQFRAGAAIGLWLLVILGLVLGIWPRSPIPRAGLIAGMCLGGLAILAALSMTWANNNEEAFIALIRVLAYLGLFVAVLLASSAGGARPWLTGLALGLGAVAVVALLSRLQPGLFAEAESIREQFGPARERLSFPTAYWNGLGACMALGITLFAWLGAEARSRLARAGVTAVIPVAVLVLFLTSSRGSIVALGLGLVVLIVLGRSRPAMGGSLALGGAAGVALVLAALAVAPTIVDGELELPEAGNEGDVLLLLTALAAAGAGLIRFVLDSPLTSLSVPRWATRVAVALAVVAGVAGLAWIDPVERVERFAELPEGRGGAVTSHLALDSGSGRFQYWEVGLDAFLSAPLVGVGAGGYEGYWAEHHAFPRPVSFAHSIVVTELAELGVAGLALILGFLVVAAVAGMRARRAPGAGSTVAVALALLAVGGAAAAVDWMWELPAVFAVVVVAAALLTGPAISPAPGTSKGRFGFGVAALVIGWATIVVALLGFFGQAKSGAAEDALEAGELQQAVDEANTAMTLQPWAAEPHLLEAAALEAQGELDAARDAAQEAIDRAPSDSRAWAVAARTEMAAGDVEEGLELLSRANALTPTVAIPRRGLR
jgi:hypothetical protein